MAGLSRPFRLHHRHHWPDPRSLATTSGVSVDVLSSGYLDVSVLPVRLHIPMNSDKDTTHVVGFPIQTFTDQRVLAPPRDFSQPITSFIALIVTGKQIGRAHV